MPGDPGDAVGRRQQRAQHPHSGRLARAVGTQEPEHLARLDRQVDPAHGLDPSFERAGERAGGDHHPARAVQSESAVRLVDRSVS
jgi:hypothetical protein